MQTSEIRYAKSGRDHIAYQCLGDGPPAIVLAREMHVGVLDQWGHPSSAYFHRRLAAFGRVVYFDARGSGASDAYGVASRPTLETWMDDLLAVLDAEACDRAIIVGCGDFGLVGLMTAATHPGRTESLILINAYARYYADTTYPAGRRAPTVSVGERLAEVWGTKSLAQQLAPSMKNDEAFLTWLMRAERASAGPGSVGSMYEPNHERDVRGLLGAIRVPTLVLHRAENRYVGVEHGRFLAEHIERAKFVELPGADHLPFVGDVDSLLDEIQQFIGARRGQRHDDTRVLATVLFTDIVGSTELASSLGDRKWRSLLDEHDALVRRIVEEHRGRLIKHVGDGILAAFDGPARGIQAALLICSAVRGLEIEVRSGLHTGEVELRGDDVGGIAVHIGARVSALAQPSEVLVTRTVKDLVAGSGIAFSDRGVHELKGVSDEWQLFSVLGG